MCEDSWAIPREDTQENHFCYLLKEGAGVVAGTLKTVSCYFLKGNTKISEPENNVSDEQNRVSCSLA